MFSNYSHSADIVANVLFLKHFSIWLVSAVTLFNAFAIHGLQDVLSCGLLWSFRGFRMFWEIPVSKYVNILHTVKCCLFKRS